MILQSSLQGRAQKPAPQQPAATWLSCHLEEGESPRHTLSVVHLAQKGEGG